MQTKQLIGLITKPSNHHRQTAIAVALRQAAALKLVKEFMAAKEYQAFMANPMNRRDVAEMVDNP